MSDYSKKFISASKIEEIKKQREAQGLPAEEEYDGRSLYERLQTEKLKKEEENAEARAFKNQVHRLDEDEIRFLDKVSADQNAQEKEAECEVNNLLKEYKSCVAREQLLNTNNTNSAEVDSPSKLINKIKSRPAASTSSQKTILANAIKRKFSNPTEDQKTIVSPNKKSKSESSNSSSSSNVLPGSNQVIGIWPSSREVTGCLPGIGEYSGESSSNDSSDSTDVEESVMTLHHIANKSDDKEKD